MKNRLFTALAFSTFAFTSPAFAGVSVTVPFAFTAGKTTLPAGTYTVEQGSAHVVTFRGSHGTASVFGTPHPTPGAGTPVLNFERTEKGYVLKTIRASGQPSGEFLNPR